MPDKLLTEYNQKIKANLRRNSIVCGILALSGSVMFLNAFSLVGTRFDTQEFCFKPENAHEPEKYCSYQQGNVYQGLAWRVALERQESIEFATKATLLKYKPAERPYTGLLGLISAGFFLTAYGIFQYGTGQLSASLFKLVREKHEEIIEEIAQSQKHRLLDQQKLANEIEFISKIQEKEQNELMSPLKSEGEKQYEILEGKKALTTQEHLHELQLAKIKAQTAESKEKEIEHLVKVKKLESKLDDPWNDEKEEKQSLETLLKEHEEGWLWDLTKGISPIIVYGKAGSAKSYTAASLVLAKQEIKGSELISISDPDFLQNKNEAWKYIYKKAKEIYGEGSDWESYREGIESAYKRWVERTLKDSPIVSIWDELTLLGRELKQEAQDFMPKIIAVPRKRNEDVILITHSVTQSGLGDCEGMSEAIKEGCFRLKLKCDALGKPKFKGFLYGWVTSEGEEIKEKEVTIPEWFRPEKLVKIIKQGEG